MIEIIKITKETFIERMKACCPSRFSDEALSLLYKHLNGDADEPWTEDITEIDEEHWCQIYKESSIEAYVRKYPVSDYEGENFPLDRKIILQNMLRAKILRHDIVGFTETTVVYSDY